MNRLKLLSILLCLFLAPAASLPSLALAGGAATNITGRITFPENPAAEAIVIHDLTVEEFDLKLAGKVRIFSLHPFTAEIHLASAAGNPNRIIGLLAAWIPLPEKLFSGLDLNLIQLTELKITTGKDETRMEIGRASFAGGVLEGISLKMEAGRRSCSIARISADKLPFRKDYLSADGPVAADGLSFTEDHGRVALSINNFSGLGSRASQLELSITPEGEEGKKGKTLRGRAAHLALDLEPFWGTIGKWPGFDLAKKLRDSSLLKGVNGSVVMRGALEAETPSILAFLPPSEEAGRQPGSKPQFSGQGKFSGRDLQLSIIDPKGAPVLTVGAPLFAAEASMDESGALSCRLPSLDLLADGGKLMSIRDGRLTSGPKEKSMQVASLSVAAGNLMKLIRKLPFIEEKARQRMPRLASDDFVITGTGELENFSYTAGAADDFTLKAGVLFKEGTVSFASGAGRKGTRNRFAIPSLSCRLAGAKERFAVEDLNLRLIDHQQGTLDLAGRLDLPLDFGTAILALNARGFTFANWKISGQAGWHHAEQKPLALEVEGPNARVSFAGRVQPWPTPGGAGIDIVCSRIHMVNLNQDGAKPKEDVSPAKAKPLFPDGPPALPGPIRLQADLFETDKGIRLEQVELQAAPPAKKGDPLVAAFASNWCQTFQAGQMLVHDDGRLHLTADLRVRNAALNNLIACGLEVSGAKTPPVFADGNLYAGVQIDADGMSLRELQDRAGLSLSLNVENGRIMNLSNIHQSSTFLLDILRLFKLNPSKLKDTLMFDSLQIKAAGNFRQGKLIDFERIAFISPLLDFHLGGTGRLDLREKAPVLTLDLDGRIKGFSTRVNETWRLAGDK